MVGILKRAAVSALGLVAVLAVAACDTPVQTQRFPQITFSHMPQISLNVAKVEIVHQYRNNIDPPHVETRIPAAPTAVLEQWARDRLKATGASGTARFVITDGAVTRESLKVESGLSGAFKTQQADRYTANASGSLEILDGQGFRRGFASAEAQRSSTVGEDATMNDRDEMLFKLIEDLSKDFDARMSKAIKEFLSGFVM